MLLEPNVLNFPRDLCSIILNKYVRATLRMRNILVFFKNNAFEIYLVFELYRILSKYSIYV